MSDRAAAEMIRTKLARYRGRGLPSIVRSDATDPAQATINGIFWELLMARDAIPAARSDQTRAGFYMANAEVLMIAQSTRRRAMAGAHTDTRTDEPGAD